MELILKRLIIIFTSILLGFFLLLFILYVEKYGLFRINITDILAPDEIIFSNIKKC